MLTQQICCGIIIVNKYVYTTPPGIRQKTNGGNKMKKIGERTVQVTFDFGSVAYVGVNLYEGKTFEECLKIRSESIDGYIENGKYIKIK